MNTETQATQLAFRALADETRREILKQLSEQEMTIGELVEQFDMTRAAVKKHLIILEQGRLISVKKQGRERINRIEPSTFGVVFDWLAYFDHYWETRLQGLKQVVEAAEAEKKT